MDYLFQPPEVNSLRMYTGAGAAPLISAATNWSQIAAELTTVAEGIASQVMGLADVWMGPSAVQMTAAAMRYVEWLTLTAGQAEQTSAQASAAAAAFEAAFAQTVPPPLIETNRLQLAVLVSTNFLGINTAAIAATEAEYAEMWAQDVSAMIGYQASSAAATQLTPFQPAPQTTTGSAAQGIAQAAASSGGWNIFAPGSNTETTGLSGLLNLFSGQSGSAFGSLLNSTIFNDFASSGLVNPGETLAPMVALAALGPAFSQMVQSQQPEVGYGPVGSSVGSSGGGFSGGAQVSAALGEAPRIGGLSVPPGFQNAAQTSLVRAVGSTPLQNVPGGGMGVPMAMPLGGNQKSSQQQPRYGIKIKSVVVGHPSGG